MKKILIIILSLTGFASATMAEVISYTNSHSYKSYNRQLDGQMLSCGLVFDINTSITNDKIYNLSGIVNLVKDPSNGKVYSTQRLEIFPFVDDAKQTNNIPFEYFRITVEDIDTENYLKIKSDQANLFFSVMLYTHPRQNLPMHFITSQNRWIFVLFDQDSIEETIYLPKVELSILKEFEKCQQKMNIDIKK